MPLSLGSQHPPQKTQIYTLPSPSSATPPGISIWRGTPTHSSPKPFSYQVYITDPSIAPPSSSSDFAANFLTALTANKSTPEPESWRLDIYFVAHQEKKWEEQDCVAHYGASRDQGLHTVGSYFGCEPWSGSQARGILLVVDGADGKRWDEEGGVRVVEFGRGVGREVPREDGSGLEMVVHYDVGEGDEAGGGDGEEDEWERKWGTMVRETRASVAGERPLGAWLCEVWQMALCRGEYEGIMGWEE